MYLQLTKLFVGSLLFMSPQLRLCCSNESVSLVFVYEDLAADTELEEISWSNMTKEIKFQCNKEEALEVFYDALAAPFPFVPVVIVDGICLEATEAVAAVSKYYCLPLISYTTPLEFPGNQDIFPHLFSVVPSDHYFAVGTVQFITYYNWQRVVVMSQDQEHHKRIKEDLLTLLESNNLTMISDVQLPMIPSRLHDFELFPPDVRIFVLNMESEEAKLVFCLALRGDSSQYRYVWIIPGWYADRWWANGANVVLNNAKCNTTDLAEFIVQQRVIAISHQPNVFNLTSQEDGVCIQDNITEALSKDARQAVIKQTTMKGGNLSSCFSRMDQSLCSPETDYCFNMILNSIRNTAFQGDSGFVKFDAVGSRIPSVVNVFQYRIVNECKVHVAMINVTSNPMSIEFVGGEDMLWIGSVPADGTPRTVEDFVPRWLTVSANIWSGLVIICSTVFITFTCTFRKRKLVRLTSPSLNYVIAVGIILFNIGGMMFIQPQVPFVVLEIFCAIRVWFVTVGISCCFVTIDVKMWRIYYIFHNPNPSKRKKVFQDWHLFLIVMLCVILDVIILTIVSAVNTARLKPVETSDIRHVTEVDEDGITVNYTVFLCMSRRKLIWLGILFGYKAIIQIIGLILALKIRNVKIVILNDSKETALSIYLSSVILAVVILVSVVLGHNLTIYSAAYAYGTALSTTAVLIIVFFTKVYRLYKDPWGEKIFTYEDEYGSGANILSGPPTSTVVLANDNDRVRSLEHKLRQVEMELSKYKAVAAEDRTSGNGSYSVRAGSEHELTADTNTQYLRSHN